MALDKRSYLYEALVRFGPEGLKGAHVKDLDEIYDTESGEVFSATEGPAREVTVAEMGDLIGPAVADAVEKLAAREAAFVEEIEAKKAEVATLIEQGAADLEAKRAEIATERANLDKLRDKLASAAAAVLSSA